MGCQRGPLGICSCIAKCNTYDSVDNRVSDACNAAGGGSQGEYSFFVRYDMIPHVSPPRRANVGHPRFDLTGDSVTDISILRHNRPPPMKQKKQLSWVFIVLVCTVDCGSAQNIPPELHGRWVIQRKLPTSTISCWGEKEAKRLIGTEIEYTATSFRWGAIVTNHPKVEIAVVTSQQFHDENSGKGRDSSQVSFLQLGIRAPKAAQVEIEHAPSTLPNTTEIPGDMILLKNRTTLVLAVCNVWFEARRLTHSSANSKRQIPCKTAANATSCYWTRGRLGFHNGTPAFRLWKVGTERVLGIYSGPSVDRHGTDNEHPEFPADVERTFDPANNRIFADFEVCPLEPEKPRTMQAACIEAAKNVAVEKK